MTIKVGDNPETKFRGMTAEGPQVRTTDDIFKGREGCTVRGAGRLHRHLPQDDLPSNSDRGH